MLGFESISVHQKYGKRRKNEIFYTPDGVKYFLKSDMSEQQLWRGEWQEFTVMPSCQQKEGCDNFLSIHTRKNSTFASLSGPYILDK